MGIGARCGPFCDNRHFFPLLPTRTVGPAEWGLARFRLGACSPSPSFARWRDRVEFVVEASLHVDLGTVE